MTVPDTPQWRNDLLQKIGGYGFSDPQLLAVAGAICAKQALTDQQRRYAVEFEARLGDEPSRAEMVQGLDDLRQGIAAQGTAALARTFAS